MALGESSGHPMPNTPSQTVRQTHSGGSNAVDDPHARSNHTVPPQRTLALWTEVAHGIDKNQTVVWKNAVDSLSEANRYFLTSEDARRFTESYMRPVISILLEQQPQKIGQTERNCVEESLKLSIIIVCEDLKAKNELAAGECIVLEVLAMVFNRKKFFYKGSKPSWNANLSGAPEVRTQMINKFRSFRGFAALGIYLSSRTTSSQFPSLDILHPILGATMEAIPTHANNADPALKRAVEDDIISVAKSVMDYMGSASEESLKKQTNDNLNTLRYDLQRIFDRLATSRRKETYSFHEFFRGFALKLITSQSLPLKLYGWDTVTDLIEVSTELRPPPKAFIVSGAGCAFVNGRYEFAGQMTDDGFARPGADIKYELHVPDKSLDSSTGGKKLTLFRCTMRSQQKWWFLSEADEEQPGTEKDIDYYQHKSKKHEENEPPSMGWVTCDKPDVHAGVDPPPTFVSKGLMVPPGEEYNTMEHQLAKWAIKNGIIELVLGDSIHREIVARSIPLIRFLAFMCNRDDPEDCTRTDVVLNEYCLQASHLKLAWKTCTSKLDAAVSAEVYQLLVSILPSLPTHLAITLLNSIQESLHASNTKRDYIFEVAEFCSALAATNPTEIDAGNNSNSGVAQGMSDDVRAKILKLLWGVLTHPDASSLKCYDQLKSFVMNELRIEPMGTMQRMAFLNSCMQALNKNLIAPDTSSCTDVIDDALALRMVKLTMFVLEACPRDQAISLVTADNATLPKLIFTELTTYLNRRKAGAGFQLPKKSSSLNTPDNVYLTALTERLNILRYVYGLSGKADMTTQQLDHLWQLCEEPGDREASMVFLANAANNEIGPLSTGTQICDDNISQPQQNLQNSLPHAKQPLTAAFTDEVRVYAFQKLFCSNDLAWEKLGPSAYHSFQASFKSLKKSVRTSLTSNGPALDALWRICLAAGNDDVASQAMRDLLNVYSTISTVKRQNNTSNAWKSATDVSEMMANRDESFAKRVFECLREVQEKLERGDASSERSAERCVRILNAAVGHSTGGGKSTSSIVSSATLSSIVSSTTLNDILLSVPHGMRGQACYRNIGIMAKRTPTQNHTVATAPLPQVRDEVGNLVISNSNARNLSTKLPSTERFSLQVHPLEPLSSVKWKVAQHCKHENSLVKPLSVSGRQNHFIGRSSSTDSSPTNLNIEPDDALVADLGITDGCEVVFLLANHPIAEGKSSLNAKSLEKKSSVDLSSMFAGDGGSDPADRFFDTLLAVLEALPLKGTRIWNETRADELDTHNLVWDLLFSVPTNAGVIDRVRSAAQRPLSISVKNFTGKKEDVMSVDTARKDDEWNSLLNMKNYQRSVYVMQVIDSFLQPANEIVHNVAVEKYEGLKSSLETDALSFRQGFIESGGFDAVLRFFTQQGDEVNHKNPKFRMGNAFALRILKCCFFGVNGADSFTIDQPLPRYEVDNTGDALMKSLPEPEIFLKSITSVVVADVGVSDGAVLDVLVILRSLLVSGDGRAQIFSLLPNAEKLVFTLLLWESKGVMTVTTVNNGSRIRKSMEELILEIPSLVPYAMPWLIKALDTVDVTSDGSSELFSVLIRLVEGSNEIFRLSSTSSLSHLKNLSTGVCKKLASHPRPTSDAPTLDFSTGVLCGCLRLLCALIRNGGGAALSEGVNFLLKAAKVAPWSQIRVPGKGSGIFNVLTSSIRRRSEDTTLIDLMGVIFDRFLSDGDSSSSSAICCNKVSRQIGFKVVAASASACMGGDGYLALSTRMNDIITAASPSLRHRWGQSIATEERGTSHLVANTSKYSGLRNQGCTCYMNSVLQQLFMMPGLQKTLCSATLPSSLRSAGSGMMEKGQELVGKRVSLQWDNGVSYDATVVGYDENVGMHTVRYYPLQIANVSHGNSGANMGHQSQQIHPDDIAALPEEMLEEFFLHEGRPGKETGVFEVISSTVDGVDTNISEFGSAGESSSEGASITPRIVTGIKENEDESSSRRLLEEVQRTFVHLDEGARGRCFDPRSLVEASSCLKLEFDVWQQNDASEFAMKLLDRLEVPLKRWSPSHFKYLEHTFRLKQTKQKICKECGLKTNREENLMNIDCQIRGKSDIHEALSTMCEVEFMEGDNKVFCDRCKKKCDTVLRTAISALPDMLILSLKRFDLDYNTFETVKLNSRCAFGQTLNMKRYTLEGVEASEKATAERSDRKEESMMDTDETDFDSLTNLPDEDYEYKLAGVLVHAGVAQGGHYYSFIKDRFPGKNEDADKWYRFDDEDVTPFDPSSIEVECFGGKVKKETKWPNGQVHTVEQEQFANALMLFYEKVKPAKYDADDDDCAMNDGQSESGINVPTTSGYDVFQADVRQSNTTHSWQSFLFDTELQVFLKNMLDLSLVSSETLSDNESMDLAPSVSSQMDLSQNTAGSSSTWQVALLNLSISFFFNVLLHSVEVKVLDEWSHKLLDALTHWREGAKSFVHELARRTQGVSKNWLRVYTVECPEDASRSAAMHVIARAMHTCLSFSEERSALDEWTRAWTKQLSARDTSAGGRRQNIRPMPTSLDFEWKSHEDPRHFVNGKASSLGVIISFLTYLLEVAPRTCRFINDLCKLISDIGSFSDDCGGEILRKALCEAQVPARLVCLTLREKSPSLLRAFFPGASVSMDIAEAMTKTETNASSHLLPLAGNSTGMTGGVNPGPNNTTMSNTSDNINVLEAIASVIGLKGIRSIPLVYETGEVIKGRPIFDLTKTAQDALATVFNECAAQSGAMGQRDILSYMKLCGVDASTVPPQRIINILTKYGKEGKYLTVDGFLSYYRDTAQTNELQVRLDLHTFGFRPDLSRRSQDMRVYSSGDRKSLFQRSESVAFDVALMKEKTEYFTLGQIAELALFSFNLYSIAFCSCEHLAEYILAFSTYERDTSRLIADALKSLYRTHPGWPGNEMVQSCVMTFKVLAALPDDRQRERITAIMQNMEKVNVPYNVHTEGGSGLLNAAKDFSMSRSSQHYSADYHNSGLFDRYLDALKELQKQREVAKWMSEHRSQWLWMEQWLRSDIVPVSQHQVRGDYLNRRDGSPVHIPSGTLNHSDSDANPAINDSEDEDDDSRYDTTDGYCSGKVVVTGAGVKAVNGTYICKGSFDNVPKYCKTGNWKDRDETFSLFRCRLSDNSKRWYISIVPKNIQPGTNKDVDFYLATATGHPNELPPEKKWTTAKDNGVDPSPTVTWKTEPVPADADEDQIDSSGRISTVVDDVIEDDSNDAMGYL